MTEAEWKPSSVETLRFMGQHREGGGFFVFAPHTIDHLIDDGLVEQYDISESQHIHGRASRLTRKGVEAYELITGVRNVSQFQMPDWVLVEAAKYDRG